MKFLPRSLRLPGHTKMLLLALAIGVGGGFGAVGFRILIRFFQDVFFGHNASLLDQLSTLPWYYILLAPAVGGLFVGPLVHFFAREAKGHGVPEVMDAVATKAGIIRPRLVVVKAFASAISIGSGGSVGREGPIVQIGSAWGSAVGQFLKLSMQEMRTLVGCGAAAGIAATFNAPIMGVIFALEIILGDFAVTTFSPIVVASVMATVISRHFIGDVPAFIIPAYKLVSVWEFPVYALLGLVVALAGVLFIKLLYGAEDLLEDLPIHPTVLPAVGGIFLGALALLYPEVLGVGYETIDKVLDNEFTWDILLILAAVKLLATSITLGSGGSGGVFSPSLFMGACLGGGFGQVVGMVMPGHSGTPGAYSLVGMGAMVAATTHAPITAILAIFELTGDYEIILPMMFACIIATVVASQLKHESIYTLKLLRRGVDIQAGKEVNVLKSLRVRDAMTKDVETLPEGMPLKTLIEVMQDSPYQNYPVVDANSRLTGIFSFQTVRPFMFDEGLAQLVVVRDVAHEAPSTIRENDNLDRALQLLAENNIEILPVVNEDDPRVLAGVLSRSDIVRAYYRAIVKRSALQDQSAYTRLQKLGEPPPEESVGILASRRERGDGKRKTKTPR